MADNDLAIGRAVEAISHSAYWDDTAFFILEDDAQNGADHVDAHRSMALVVSKYAPQAADGGAFVDSRFYSTVSVVRTMETLLGLPPMNNNDAFSSMIGIAVYGAGRSDAVCGGLYESRQWADLYGECEDGSGREGVGEDGLYAMRIGADAQKLNVILWKDAMGDKPVPAQLLENRRRRRRMMMTDWTGIVAGTRYRATRSMLEGGYSEG